jgi:hypothetical protein
MPGALRQKAAAEWLGISEKAFVKHVRPSLPRAPIGTLHVFPLTALEAWLDEHTDPAPSEELDR